MMPAFPDVSSIYTTELVASSIICRRDISALNITIIVLYSWINPHVTELIIFAVRHRVNPLVVNLNHESLLCFLEVICFDIPDRKARTSGPSSNHWMHVKRNKLVNAFTILKLVPSAEDSG
ncbi:hypothetical protein RF11_08332 [Thelohanellus kitauei]|uniref:Uncharacterized protein n=1 Tax=Thelohanellus kitauei TaxID=669202 RepID=A0A0C2N276_THEKT|nr:hypothetical protein RF11_08332 [Thelohanellus kitauei]